MLDGYNELNNLIIFGLTNRIDILDPAILRPGRFSLTIKVDLPNVNGREEILKIHCKKILDNGYCNNIDFQEISKLTEGYSGGDIEFLVQKTIQDKLNEQIDYSNITKSASKINNINIKTCDFIKIIKDNSKNKNNNLILGDPMLMFEENDIKEIINFLVPEISSHMFTSKCKKIVISGNEKSGKTSLVAEIIRKLNDKNKKVEYISSKDVIFDNPIELFTKFLLNTESTIFIDDVELILDFINIDNFDKKKFMKFKFSYGKL